MSDCPGPAPDEYAPDPVCLACGYDICGACTTAHTLPGAHPCLPCAEAYGGRELAEVLESSAAYTAALANLRADPAPAGLGPQDDQPPTPQECAEAGAAFVNGTVDRARCEECGGPACTHCEAHLAAGPHTPCEECGRRLIHVLNLAENRR
ncbi:hypothetical protein AB0N09_40070 [Streptomyces erythrochromogenes]|uniref:hypothetical protein n=1 Tax=Streptomyces erythrochromogenes TaxID=285574 RepID=UPI00341B818D